MALVTAFGLLLDRMKNLHWLIQHKPGFVLVVNVSRFGKLGVLISKKHKTRGCMSATWQRPESPAHVSDPHLDCETN